MNCKFKDREAFIEKYLAKKLAESEQNLFEEHFFSCEECFSELEATKQMMEMVKQEGEVLFPEYNKKREGEIRAKFKISDLINKIFPPKWYLLPSSGYAFIAATVLFVGLYFLYPSVDNKNNTLSGEQFSISENDNSSQIDKDSKILEQAEIVKKTPTAELYAANYIVSDDLEYLIDQGFRDNDFVKVLSPETVITAKDEILFNWVSDTEQKLYLKILNNQEVVLHKLTPDKNKILFNITENKLDPGLYYWKLESDKELLQLGKFFVKE